MNEKANLAGAYVSTAERNSLMAMVLRLGAAEFETRAIGQLAVTIAARRGGCMRYDNIAIFDGEQLSHLSHNAIFSDNAVFDITYFDMKPLMRASAIPSGMR
jgi:hypothetical protein